MVTGICIYAEYDGNVLDPIVPELVTAARQIKEETGEPIQVLLVAEKCAALSEQIELLGVDEIYAVETKSNCLFKDDSIGHVICQALELIKPSAALIPASATARSLFSRAAVLMGSGLTADCTDLEVVKDQSTARYYLKQHKPSFGDNVMVSIITRECCYPQMMTVRQGIYLPCAENSDAKTQIRYLNEIEIPASKVEILETTPHQGDSDSISSARIVCVGGRGALTDGNLELLQEFAAKIGAAVAGTRPLAEEGIIPFENQIGQTGKTIRPQICVSFGVSGAIQHTEGIKETKLFIAVNNDKNSAIFNVADYGAIADLRDILTCALKAL